MSGVSIVYACVYVCSFICLSTCAYVYAHECVCLLCALWYLYVCVSSCSYNGVLDFDLIPDNMRPLRDEEAKAIDGNLDILVDFIDFAELEGKVLYEGCISERQRKRIASRQTDHGKTCELLATIRRNSYESFVGFLRCFEDTKQNHVAHLLKNGGGD